jgi:hypothetical protein
MHPTRQTLGFDRFIRLAWLDATAEGVARGLEPSDLRDALDAVLNGEVGGTGPHSARGKTKTVLLRIWHFVPEPLRPVRDEALAHFVRADLRHRLTLHWGMTAAAYPFFADVTTTIGRLSGLQGVVSRAQLRHRLSELWGERTTVERAWPRAIASLVDWGVLDPTEQRDLYRPRDPLPLTDLNVQRWLVEAAFVARGNGSVPFEQLARGPALFPFRLSLSAYDLRHHPRLDVVRLGLDEEVVVRRTMVRARPPSGAVASI